MAPDERDEGFRITDRRRRTEEDAPPRSRPATSPPPPPIAPSGDTERSLVGLFMMLGSSALMALGEAADPTTGERRRDLPAAAEIIDTLLLLRDKTDGRRSGEESQVIDEILYDLQLRYVNAMKRSG